MKLGMFLASLHLASAASCLPTAPADQDLVLSLDVSNFNESSVRVDMGPNSTLTITINTTGMGDAFGLSVLPCAGSTHPQTLLRSGSNTTASPGGFTYGWGGTNIYWHCFIGRKNDSTVPYTRLPYYCWRNKWDGRSYSYSYNALSDTAIGSTAIYEARITTLPGQAAVLNLFGTLGDSATHKKWLTSGSTTCSRSEWIWDDPRDETNSPTPGCSYEAWAVPFNASCPMVPNPNYRCGLEYFGTKVSVAPLSTSGPICHGGYARDCTTAETGLPIDSYLVGMLATCPTNASESIFDCIINVTAPTPMPTRTPTKSPTPAPSHAPTVPTTSVPTLQPTLAPNGQSTLAPNGQSTLAPSAQSTLAPSAQSTLAPSAQSTLAPSSQSTGSTSAPSTAPSTTKTQQISAAAALEPQLLGGSLLLSWFCLLVQ